MEASNIHGSLNFAYCPAIPLKMAQESESMLEELEELSGKVADECNEYFSESVKHFYICYSMKIDDSFLDQNKANYFYFQLFSQVGLQQLPSDPIYGFFSEENILDIIKNIDSMFSFADYDKQVFDTLNYQTSGNLDQLIKLMQEWTSLKLVKFSEMYFFDKETTNSLSNLVECIKNSTNEINPKTKPKKTRRKINSTKTHKTKRKHA